MSGDEANIFRTALALDPDDRYETLMEFLTALIDVYPLEDTARERINELFRRDDHAGDIVPLRRMRSRPTAQEQTVSARGMGTRATGSGHSRLIPGYGTSSTLKIELEEETVAGFASSSPRSTQGDRKPAPSETIQPKTLIWWIIVVVLGGQLFWWLYARLTQPGH
jgi:hypothetical protein